MEQDKRYLKLIVAGLPRTGTMSMKAALEELGYGPCHHLLEPACQIARLRRSAAVLNVEPGQSRQAALQRLLEGYEVSIDVPGSACVDELLALHPDAKVILTTRTNGHVWLDSYTAIFSPIGSFTFRSIGYWVPGVDSCARMVLYWNRHYELQFPGTKAPSPEMYDKHTDFIRNVTPPSNLLEFEVGSGWKPLCEFLGKPVPDKPFPRKNERSYLVNINRLAYASGCFSWLAILSAAIYAPWARLFGILQENEFLQTLLLSQSLLLLASVLVRNLISRGLCLVFVIYLISTSFTRGNIKAFTDNGITNAVIFSCICVQLIRAVEILLFEPSRSPPPDLVQGINDLWNMRDIGNPGQIPNIPKSWSNPRLPRILFLIQRMAALIVWYLILENILTAPLSPPTESLAEAAVISISSTAAFWIVLYMYLSLIYDALCITQVALFMSEPSDWPPLFGSVCEAYSIRRFWGVTWHQTLRKPFGPHADRALRLFGVPTWSNFGRYAKLCIVFGFSGGLHWVADFIIGVPWSESRAMQFFVLQSFGIMLEDMIRNLNDTNGLVLSPLLRRMCGYLWLATWLAATTPAWMHGTAAYIRPGIDVMLPMQGLASIPRYIKGF